MGFGTVGMLGMLGSVGATNKAICHILTLECYQFYISDTRYLQLSYFHLMPLYIGDLMLLTLPHHHTTLIFAREMCNPLST